MALQPKILSIETSCDECSASIVTQGSLYTRALSNIVKTQIELHRPFGGVVPEIASRNHLEIMIPVVDEALKQAQIKLGDVDAFAVTHRPGLIGALLVGVSTAKALAFSQNKPLIGVHHLEGHIHSLFLEQDGGRCPLPKDLPALVLLVSGGHTQLYLLRNLPPEALSLELLAQSRDDAAGEAFDKGAKLMGLPYPGGRHVDEWALKGNHRAFPLPRPQIQGSLDFSFSGLKTAVQNTLLQRGFQPHIFGDPIVERCPQGETLADLCASLQEAILDCLLTRIDAAAKENRVQSLLVVGGVSANRGLRQRLDQGAWKDRWFAPPLEYCTDNAAMIGACALYQFKRNEVLTGTDLLALNAFSV